MSIRFDNPNLNSQIAEVSKRIDKAIIWVTLSALIGIPLLFSYFDITAVFNEPKIFFLHATAILITILWLCQLVLKQLNPRVEKSDHQNYDLRKWAKRNPARWALIGAFVWIFAQLAATLLSPLPLISFFGGDEARSGYNLYDSLSLTVIFVAIAVRFRSIGSLSLLAHTLVITGAIAAAYGTAQHFSWDPIGGNIGLNRVQASFGNTLNFAGYLVMSIPATIALAHIKKDRRWLWISFIVIALALQLAGIYFASGRGPFIALAVSLITFFGISLTISSTKTTISSLKILLASGLLALILILIPTPSSHTLHTRLLNIGASFDSSTSVTTDIQGGLAGRFSIWESSFKLARQWDVPITEPLVNSALRPLFGLGPDMYVYSYPLIGKPSSQLTLVDHTHNYQLHLLMEQGFIGLIGFTMLAGFSVLCVFIIVKTHQQRNRDNDITKILILALFPALIGKLFELQTGVARVSDLAMTIALLGSTIAFYEILNQQFHKNEIEPHNRSITNQPLTSHQPIKQLTLMAGPLIALTVIAILLTVFINWDIRRLSASLILANGHESPNLDKRANAWTDAQTIAPERETITFGLFEAYLQNAKEQYKLGNNGEAMRLMMVGREMLLKYEQRDPLLLNVQIGLSKTTSTLAEWGHHEYLDELTYRSQKLASIAPAYPTLLGTTATAMTSVGLHKLAIEYADMAIATEKTTQPWSKAWYAKGRSLYELGNEDEAIAALTKATEKQPGSEAALLAHQFLAEIYRVRGNSELSEMHLELGGSEITFDK